MAVTVADSNFKNSDWPIALAGLAAMYLPVYWWAANGIWQTDEQAHGAIILLVTGWLFWELRQPILLAPKATAPRPGWICLAFGLMVYVVGRLFNISILELASQLPVILGTLLVLRGWSAARAAWFPLVYIIFMVPLPGILVDAATGPLKQWISVIAENSLYAVGYPIARNGVVLSVGPYQLLVADACSGLHSMFSLSALGVLLLYLKQRAGWLHNAIMLASILPIAFFANVVRVLVLILITYHLGDEAGQGYLHGSAGIALLLIALSGLLALDFVLARVLKTRPAA